MRERIIRRVMEKAARARLKMAGKVPLLAFIATVLACVVIDFMTNFSVFDRLIKGTIFTAGVITLGTSIAFEGLPIAGATFVQKNPQSRIDRLLMQICAIGYAVFSALLLLLRLSGMDILTNADLPMAVRVTTSLFAWAVPNCTSILVFALSLSVSPEAKREYEQSLSDAELMEQYQKVQAVLVTARQLLESGTLEKENRLYESALNQLNAQFDELKELVRIKMMVYQGNEEAVAAQEERLQRGA